MGIFGGGYDRPGKGIDKNAPKKRGFFLYLELVARKLTKFIQVGLLYTLFSIPLIVAVYLLSAFVFIQPISALQTTALEIMKQAGVPEAELGAQLGTISFMICATLSVFFVMLWGNGPFSAAVSYIFRCFTREEHVWIISDGKDKVKENAKQGFLVLLIDLLIFVLAPTAIVFYFNMSSAMPQMRTLCSIITYMLVLFIIIYTIMHPYMFQFMVTFKCSFKEIFKNSFLLALAKLPINLLLTAISVAVIFIPAAFFASTGAMLMALGALTFGNIILRYPMEFYASRTIKKLLIDTESMKEKNAPNLVYDEAE